MTPPYYQDEWVTIYHGDCRDLLEEVPFSDLLLTDPPYGSMRFRKRGFSDESRVTRQTSKWAGGRYGRRWGSLVGDEEPPALAPWISKAQRAVIWGGHLLCSQLPDSPGWLAWDKKVGGSEGLLTSDVDLAWTNCLGHSRLFSHMWVGLRRQSEVGEHLHPTQKPVALMRWCLGLVPSAQSVLDPFMGSGSTLRAAKDLSRKAIGIEIEERYCEIAAHRMGQEVLAI